MKAWITICAIVLAAGGLTVLAQETKTDTQASATPNTNEVAVPPPVAAPVAPAPAVAKEVKPPVVAPRTAPKAVVPPPVAEPVAPAPAAVSEVKPPDVVPLVETSAVPAQTNIAAEPLTPTNAAVQLPERSGIGRNRVLVGGVALLVVVAGLLMWQRFRAASRGSLITSAMSEDQKSREDKNAPPPMT